MAKIGLEQDRLRMFQMSSAQAAKFAEAAREMAEQVESLGPSPLRAHGQVASESPAVGTPPVEKNTVE